MHFTGLDIAILIIIMLSMLVSFFRGFVREAVSLAIWAVAFLAAIKLAEPLGEHLSPWVHSNTFRYVLAFAGIVIVIFLLGVIVNILLRSLLERAAGLSLFDRLLGVVFGAARGILVVAIIVMFVSSSTMQKASWAKNSRFAPNFIPLAHWLQGFMPEKVKQVTQWVTPAQEMVG